MYRCLPLCFITKNPTVTNVVLLKTEVNRSAFCGFVFYLLRNITVFFQVLITDFINKSFPENCLNKSFLKNVGQLLLVELEY